MAMPLPCFFSNGSTVATAISLPLGAMAPFVFPKATKR